MKACNGASLIELGDRVLRANAFNDLLLGFSEDWDYGDVLFRHDDLMERMESGAHHSPEWELMRADSHPLSAVEAVRAGFRDWSGSLDDGFTALAAMEEQNQVLDMMHMALQPRLRDGSIDFNVGEVLEHPKYGWRAIVLGYETECRMDRSWVVENAHDEHDEDAIGILYSAPWYDILCDDGVLRYGSQLTHERAREEFEFEPNASPGGPVMLDMLFDSYDEHQHRYVANEDLAHRYPDKETLAN
eukprot:TRINITY_DN2413_c0_g1_i3.p1 TRINITY_DN2413_c0_g1~~TRINITY_DN2413_c0_g1_i3.p1  ORF type:complete len:245 (-),score=64.71 TRINITY_DN2413_c0_g1_i3:307-1041(-)